ncbi:hypothetical protein AZE42_07634 [Rhizopogon vesiculosus]|uniref:Uncharacterized protein n=1 Tax=Rhizopogon vesiculosus TaxID=180088 RepID=A0A1J8Q1P2_9AGAM|nr:hypothetical protein AZE42_07634 [Rhizopogon vesiculosus]
MTPNYESWSKEDLIARLKQLELETTTTTTTTKHPSTSRSSTSKPFHFASHPKRKIAIEFCYSGWGYNGLIYQNGPTPLPMVEDVLFKPFVKARLVDEKGRVVDGRNVEGQIRDALPTESLFSSLQSDPSSSSSSSSSAIVIVRSRRGGNRHARRPSHICSRRHSTEHLRPVPILSQTRAALRIHPKPPAPTNHPRPRLVSHLT